jgi:hypothetical protein
MSTFATATDNTQLDLDSLPVTLGYTGSNLTTLTIVYRENTYIQTLTYSGANVVTISNWIKQ